MFHLVTLALQVEFLAEMEGQFLGSELSRATRRTARAGWIPWSTPSATSPRSSRASARRGGWRRTRS